MKSILGLAAVLLALPPVVACSADRADDVETSDAVTAATSTIAQRVTTTLLVSDQAGTSAVTVDPNLVNPWGVAFNPAGPVWISNAGTGTSTVYDAAGVLKLKVDVPGAAPRRTSQPTGQIFNGSATAFGGDKFVFVTLDGAVSGWQPSTGTQLKNTVEGAVYTGLAVAAIGDTFRLYAADFAGSKIDVFDASYEKTTTAGSFTDPNLPEGFAPFNAQALGGKIYVAYAQQGTGGALVETGPGKGFVDVFDVEGVFLKRLVSGTYGQRLNAPWGLAIAPANFGAASGALVVGNFGDGTIHLYDAEVGDATGGPPCLPSMHCFHPTRSGYKGVLGDEAGEPLVIDGLWALAFGPEAGGSHENQLYFTAGVGGEKHGLYGRFEALP